MIIAAIAVCTLGLTPIDKCNERTAKEILFPAQCAERGRCLPTAEYIYDDASVPYRCLADAQKWVADPSLNIRHPIGRDEFIVVRCGRFSTIMNRFGTI